MKSIDATFFLRSFVRRICFQWGPFVPSIFLTNVSLSVMSDSLHCCQKTVPPRGALSLLPWISLSTRSWQDTRWFFPPPGSSFDANYAKRKVTMWGWFRCSSLHSLRACLQVIIEGIVSRSQAAALSMDERKKIYSLSAMQWFKIRLRQAFKRCLLLLGKMF